MSSKPTSSSGSTARDLGLAIASFIAALGLASPGPISAQPFAPISQHLFVTLDAAYEKAFGDVNGDGLIDLAISAWQRVDIRLGIGEGRFATGGETVLALGSVNAVALGDLDGDGDLDLVIAGSPTSVRLNLGGGTFTETGQDLTLATAYSLLLEDLDGNGNLDLIVGLSGDVVTLFGDGTGQLSPGQTIAIGGTIQGLALADIDDDGDLDLAASRSIGSGLAVRLGAGGGLFETTGPEVPVAPDPYDVVFADLNLDGFDDIVTASSAHAVCSVRWGLGDGTFAPIGIEVPITSTSISLDVGDVNLDGAPDIVAANLWESSVSIRLNDGSGQFEDADQEIPVSSSLPIVPSLQFTVAVDLVDLDEDGDPDLSGIYNWGFGTDFVFVSMNAAIGFRRGDSNADGLLDVADPITLISLLFYGGAPLLCEDSGDVNDDGVLDIADPIAALNHLFISGAPIPPPIGVCGSDPTPDDLSLCTEACP